MKDNETTTDNEFALFETREAGNEGIEFPLYDPVTNIKTSHWLRVLSVDSDAYAAANTKAMRKAVEIGKIEDDREREAALEEQSLNIIASLVTDWSFKKHFSEGAVREFLKNAPQIKNAVNRVAADRALFMTRSSQSSTDTPKSTSN